MVNTARRTKRWKLRHGADEYQGHTSAIEVNPNPVSWQGGDDNTITDDGDATINITMAQDTENPDSLWRLCNDNAGDEAVFTFNPHHDGTFAVSVKTTLVRPPLVTNRAGIPEVQVTLTGTYVANPA